MTAQRSDATSRTVGQSVLRVIGILAGFLLLLIGLAMFSFSGPNRHLLGGLVGAIGGVLFGLMRKAPLLKWYSLGGGVLGAVLVIGLMQLLHDLSQDPASTWLFGLLSGACTGLGLGLLVEARSTGKPRRSHDPDSIEPHP